MAFWSSWAEAQLLHASSAKHQFQKRGGMGAENSYNFNNGRQQEGWLQSWVCVFWKSMYGWIIRMCIYWGICIQDPHTLCTLRKILGCISGFNNDWRVLNWLALKELQDSQLSLPCSDLWAKQLRLCSTVLAFLKGQEWSHRSSCLEKRQAGRSHSAILQFCKPHLLFLNQQAQNSRTDFGSLIQGISHFNMLMHGSLFTEKRTRNTMTKRYWVFQAPVDEIPSFPSDTDVGCKDSQHWFYSSGLSPNFCLGKTLLF